MEDAPIDTQSQKKRKIEEVDDKVHQPFTKKRKIVFDLETNLVLPREIMLEIMENLDPDDIRRFSEVCKYWLTCSLEVVGWTSLGEEIRNAYVYQYGEKNAEKLFTGTGAKSFLAKLFRASKALLDKFISTTPQKGNEHQIGPQVTIQLNFREQSIEFLDEAGRVISSISAAEQRAYMRYIFSDYFGVFEDTILAHPCPGWRVDANIARKSRIDWSGDIVFSYYFVVQFYIHAKTYQRAIYAGEEFPKEDLIYTYGVVPEVEKVLKAEHERLAALAKTMFPFIPPKIVPPAGLKDGFKFHRYQLDAISWMKSTENNVDKVPWRASRTNLLYDLHNKKAVLPNAASEYIGTVKAKGGVLADVVGLGKTVELIGLVLATQGEQQPEYDDDGLFNTKATLVICPNHLAMQWRQEVSKYTALKVCMITTTEDLKTTTYGDIVNADFVIMTSQIFKNKNYFALGCGKKKVPISAPGLEKRHVLITEFLRQLKLGTKLATVAPIMDNFHFKRIIIDEGHEVLKDSFTTACIVRLKKDFAWYVSATPFPSPALFGPTKKFLEIWKPDYTPEKTLGDEYEEYVENDVLVSNLLWRNTKESIDDEYCVPDYEEELVLAEFHPIETVLHKYGKHQENLRLCCGLLNSPPSGHEGSSSAHVKEMTFDALKDWWINDLTRSINVMTEKRKQYGENWNWSRNAQQELELKRKSFQAASYVVKDQPLTVEELVQKHRVNEYGTKCAKLIQWLLDCIAEQSSNRFILFSKYTDYLNKLSARLAKEGIKNVVIAGNVIHKSKALQQFREEDIRVVLLSLERSASGMNLIEANYVVLLDPMDGTVEEARAYEIQALGRAHRQGQAQKVTLVRFVSVEEELYLRNKSSGRDTSDKLNRTASVKNILAKSNSAASLRDLLDDK